MLYIFQWGLKKNEPHTWVLVKHFQQEVSKSVVHNE